MRVAVHAEGETAAEVERHVRYLPGLWAAAAPMQVDLGRAVEGDVQVTVSAVAGDGSLDASGTFIVDERGRVTAQ